jgi:hypothetical protein
MAQIGNKLFNNIAGAGETPIYQRTGGGTGGGGGVLASGQFQFNGGGVLSAIRADGISIVTEYLQGSFAGDGLGYHFSLSTPIDTPIVNYSITNCQLAGGPMVQSIFYHTSDPTTSLTNWVGGGGYSGNVSTGLITDIAFIFWGGNPVNKTLLNGIQLAMTIT